MKTSEKSDEKKEFNSVWCWEIWSEFGEKLKFMA